MDNVVNFANAKEMRVVVDLEGVTMVDVLESLINEYDMSECLVVYRTPDNETAIITCGTEQDAVNLLEDTLDGL